MVRKDAESIFLQGFLGRRRCCIVRSLLPTPPSLNMHIDEHNQLVKKCNNIVGCVLKPLLCSLITRVVHVVTI